MAITHLNRDDLAHVTDEDLDTTSISRPESTPDGVSRTMGSQRNVQTTLDSVMNIQEPEETTEGTIGNELSPEQNAMLSARALGFTGDICATCGSSQMVRNGTCLKCNECGETTGCS